MPDTSVDKNAYTVLTGLLKQWGLDSLAPKIKEYLTKGYSGDAISYLLQQTPEYKKRFAANDQRIKHGLAPLSPADYIRQEDMYYQVLRQAGVPTGFYDKHDDFTSFIANDVSPAEVQKRALDAAQFVYSADPAKKQALKSYYGIDDRHLVAYFLDPKKALPLLEQHAAAAMVGAAALNQHLSAPSRSRAEFLADNGVDANAALQGYGQIAGMLPDEQRLAKRYGQTYSQTDAENETFLHSGLASQKRKQINNQEEASFSGDSAARSGGLTNYDRY